MSEEGYPEVPIVIVDLDGDDNDLFAVRVSTASGKRYLAICLINPQLRAAGETEDIAIAYLKQLIIAQCGGGSGISWDGSSSKPKKVKYRTISFNNELVEEVMDE